MGDPERILERSREPVDITCVSLSSLGQGVDRPFTTSIAITVSIAASTATPQVSPSPWRRCPSPIEKSRAPRARDEERPGLRIHEREVDHAGDMVVWPTHLAAERILGHSSRMSPGRTVRTGGTPPNVHANSDGSGR
jgi:hypothetical protein